MSDALARIRAILSTTPQRWVALADSVPDELFRLAPAAGEWSALECLQHIIDTERVFPVRVRALRQGQDVPAFDPLTMGSQGQGEATPRALAAALAQMRATSLALFDEVREEQLGSGGVHAELGPVTLGQLLHEWAAHDLDHTIQAERAVMQPFIRGCGPWDVYFAANRIDG